MTAAPAGRVGGGGGRGEAGCQVNMADERPMCAKQATAELSKHTLAASIVAFNHTEGQRVTAKTATSKIAESSKLFNCS